MSEDKKPRRSRKWKPLIGIGVGVLVLALLILNETGALRGGRIDPGTTPIERQQAPPGLAVMIEEQSVPIFYEAVGTLRSRDQVDVSARILARIVDVKVRSGAVVKKGDLLAELDDKDLLTGVAQTREGVTSAEANVAGANRQVDEAKAARDLSVVERDRVRRLRADGVSTPQELDRVEAAARQAAAAWQRALQGVKAAEAQVAAASQVLKAAEITHAYARIVSPMDGVVCERLADPGDLATPGKTLLRVFDPARLRLEVPVRESLVSAVHLGDKVGLEVPAVGKHYSGEVREIVPAVDPGSRTFLVKVSLGVEPDLRPGMFATLRLPLGEEQVIIIPARAVTRVGQLEYVTVLVGEGASATRRELVRTILETETTRRVISGLEPGMRMVVGGD
jgi:HlyD family secretion protein